MEGLIFGILRYFLNHRLQSIFVNTDLSVTQNNLHQSRTMIGERNVLKQTYVSLFFYIMR